MKTFNFDDVILANSQSNKPSVVLRGAVLTQSGYGVHTRMIARYLLNLHDAGKIELRLNPTRWGETPWYIDREALGGFIGRLMELSVDDKKQFDVSFQVQLPNEWDPNLGKTNIGITAGVETDRCNPNWIQAINRMSMVIVPSKHVLESFKTTGPIHVKTVVIPESFPDCFLQSPPDVDFQIEPEFNFLVVGQLTSNDPKSDRKRLHDTIQWLVEAFAGDSTTGIVLKMNAGNSSRLDRAVCERMLRQYFKLRVNDFPKITLVHGMLSDEEMLALYKHPKIGAYVTCTRGEGFGLPILEAAATGLPIIATDWSGHLDFLSKGKFIKLIHALKPIPDSRCDDNIFMKGTCWAEVNKEDFKTKALKLRKSNFLPKQWAKELQEEILKTHSYEAISHLYDDVLNPYIQ